MNLGEIFSLEKMSERSPSFKYTANGRVKIKFQKQHAFLSGQGKEIKGVSGAAAWGPMSSMFQGRWGFGF